MQRPNVLFVVMDTSRAEVALDRNVMPTVSSIATEGTTFKNAFTTAPWSLPSHASIFTGQYSSRHNTQAASTQFEPDVPPLAEVFTQQGYETHAISNNIWISPEFGFDQGFQTFQKGWQLVKGGADIGRISKEETTVSEQARAIADELLRTDAPQTIVNTLFALFARKRYDSGAWLTNKRLFRWLQSRDDSQPFFAFLNYLEPHLPYDPPDDAIKRIAGDKADLSEIRSVSQDAWKYLVGNVELSEQDFSHLKTLYAAELSYLDKRLEKVYNKLDSLGILDETIIIITGDHGENIGDHGLMDHQYCLYDTLLHVPLIIRYPPEFDGGTESTGLVELRDIYPSLIELCDIDRTLNDTQSNHTITHQNDREYVIGEYLTPQPSMDTLESRFGTLPNEVQIYDRALASIRNQEWKLIIGSDGSESLYDLHDDPREQKDVYDHHEDIAKELRSALPEPIKNVKQGNKNGGRDINGRTERRLQDLGYL